MSAPVQPASDSQAIPAVARPATTRPRFPSTWVLKVWMAITGTVLVAFVIFHMAGNLKVFLGKEDINTYAFWLQEDFLAPLIPHGWFVWIFRMVLLACVLVHIYAAVAIRRRGRVARGGFKRTGLKGLANFQARSMLVTGTVLACFIVFHILDLTVGARPIAAEGFQHVEGEHAYAYENLVASFERPGVAIFYILAMGVLFLHLAHGTWSVVNDLGATGRRLRAFVFAIAGALALLVMLGNIAIPFAVMIGVVS